MWVWSRRARSPVPIWPGRLSSRANCCMPRNSAAYLWSRKLAKPVEAFPAKKCLAAPRAEGPKAWVQSGAEQGTQKPKKTSPPIRGRGCGLGPGWRGHENSYRSQPESPENEAQGFPLRLRSKKSESGTTGLVDFDALPQLTAEAQGCGSAKDWEGAGNRSCLKWGCLNKCVCGIGS